MSRSLLAAAILLAFSACDSPSAPETLSPVYKLMSVDESPLPFVAAVYGNSAADRTEYRVVARAIVFGPGNKVQYEHSEETITYHAGVAGQPLFACSSMTGTYSSSGNQIVLTFDPNQFNAPGTVPQPVTHITLERVPGALVEKETVAGSPSARTYRYGPFPPVAPICPN